MTVCQVLDPITVTTHDSDEIVDRGERWLLVERVQGGDADAFGELYDRYVDVVYRFVLSRVRHQQRAEDITSEAFTRALRSIHSISYRGQDIGAWLVTIARNLVFDDAKSARARYELVTDDCLDGREQAPSAESIALEQFADRDIVDALQSISAQQRQCITLRFIQQLSLKETAVVMGCREGAVKSLQHRALRALVAVLEAEGITAAA
ncbi:MAG TPA: sigma-70 family RNA polymerase sigma factor [Jatrophihabitans sp.]|jgi:RNA polymerase sigma-70 factor (ECF subfamily)|uniref:sigma-70 family RNA polymerase sigma factor n=1 Tax=Jatrophihabitans sp. TaxID=1932789 RepID=UPI002DF89696|nr:sigma-70 family RNA polymerase sigma factor [Jatrophihabitans sp.]